MSKAARIQLAIAIVLVDVMVFAVPLCAVLLAYVLIARPVWFAKMFTLVYGDKR